MSEEIEDTKAVDIGGFMKNILTGPDNKTHDISRVQGFIAFLFGLSLQAFITITTGVFDLSAYANGVGALMGWTAVSVAVKHHTEPKPE